MSDDLIVLRKVEKMVEAGSQSSDASTHTLEELRDLSAWVLLGEPGSGKSTVFETEAKESGGLWISIAEFSQRKPDIRWRDQTLFLDGLDETRASGSSTNILTKVSEQLLALGRPKFRIACRAADWFSSTDRESFSDMSPDGKLEVFTLQPLDKQDTQEILTRNHKVEDAKAFVKMAADQGLDGLLSNPQTLKLLAKSVKVDDWPKTRQETFERSCEKLADEDSPRHRNLLRITSRVPVSIDRLLDAAGHIFAALLLSNSSGVSLDRDSADLRFPLLEDIKSPDPEAAKLVTGRKLFRQSSEGEERLEPVHRSIAEYLSARWLAKQLDHKGLPLQRVFNLLLGNDGRTVSGLRGLYGWLALCSQEARGRLIKADPVTVIVYGDAKPLPSADKRSLLSELKSEARQHPGFMSDIWQLPAWGGMVDLALLGDFRAAMESPDRDEASQAFVNCVLEILVKGMPLHELKPLLGEILRDATRWEGVRVTALEVWLGMASPEERISLLDEVFAEPVNEVKERLVNTLLMHLYPDHLAPERLFSYLRATVKDGLRAAKLSSFWSYDLPKAAREEHLPVLLDELASLRSLKLEEDGEYDDGVFNFRVMSTTLLARGIQAHGDKVTDERLYAWLGVSNGENDFYLPKERREEVANWLSKRPERYKAVLSLCYENCREVENYRYCLHADSRRLHNAAVPDDLGLWHLGLASTEANEKLVEHHLSQVVWALIYQRGNKGLSLELLEQWATKNPKRSHLLEPLLAWPVDDWRVEDARRKRQRTLKQQEDRQQHWSAVKKVLPEIRSATASAGWMYELSRVWQCHISSSDKSETVLERFEDYSLHADTVLYAVDSGFRQCPLRDDIPTASEIIAHRIEQKRHYLCDPCLIGMDLRWQDDVRSIEALDDAHLRSMVAFHLTHGTVADPEWFLHCLHQHAALVAEIQVDYELASLKAGQTPIHGGHEMETRPDYRQVAIVAVPKILTAFPVRVASHLLGELRSLIKTALNYSVGLDEALLDSKITTKSMDAAQKVYWLTTAMLVAPTKYESLFLKYVGNSWKRASHLCSFLNTRMGEQGIEGALTARAIARLIELLTPHAEIGWHSGTVTESMRRGDYVESLVFQLSSNIKDMDAESELDRLISLPSLSKLKFKLTQAKNELRLKKREALFRFSSLSNVVQILANQAPTNSQDLLALTVVHLDKIADEIRTANDDGFRKFWNVENKKNTGKREENLCRDELLIRLRHHLASFGIDCQPEGDYANDKRADIRLSFQNQFELPIEIKRDENNQDKDTNNLWAALRTQLINQYTTSTKATGCGIYLVLWFGAGDQAPARDGGKKPPTPCELQQRLEATLTEEERSRIVVRVLDVSWPV